MLIQKLIKKSFFLSLTIFSPIFFGQIQSIPIGSILKESAEKNKFYQISSLARSSAVEIILPFKSASGSGVIMTEDGYIITNNHVIDNASEVEVLLNDNSTYKATVEGADPTTDIAVLKIDAKNLPIVEFGDSDDVEIGEWVLAVGSPFEFRSTVTAGIVSAKARNIGILRDRNNLQIEAFIQHQAPVNPGNSGGALVDLKGKLVGINTAIATPTGTFAGYSFAIPSNLVKKVYEDLSEFGIVQRALLGITILDVNAEIAKERDLPVLTGVIIDKVNDGSSAADAGLDGDPGAGTNQTGTLSELVGNAGQYEFIFSSKQTTQHLYLQREADLAGAVPTGFTYWENVRDLV